MTEAHKHCVRCGVDIHLLAKNSLCENCPDIIGALHRKQDKDWESWNPKQREKARKNGEFYGDDRIA